MWAYHATGIMDHYAANLRGYNNSFNGPLEAAWASQKWGRAAEILNSTGAPWPPSAVAAFATMLQTHSVPMLWNGSCDNGNWELSMIEGLSSIAVFTENATLWDRAMAMWRVRVPAYLYYAPVDGPHPAPGPSYCKDPPYWGKQAVYNASVNGVCQETCRDFGHTGFGIASTFNVGTTQGHYVVQVPFRSVCFSFDAHAAETARIQGVDLYGEQAPRLAAALEFHTAFLNQGGYPPHENVSAQLVCSGAVLKLSTFPTYQVRWEMGYSYTLGLS